MTPTSILVVDDEPAHVEAICQVLGLNGFATTGCTDGKAALDAMARQHFDLLLADLMMPGMDGIAVLKGAQAADPTMVTLIMTGAGTIGSAVEAMKAGAFDYLLKPFRISEILPVLARALTVRQLRLDNVALQARLVERTRELEAANRSMERMLGIVAHDLRAPLNGISACIRMLLERKEIVASGVPICEAIELEARKLTDLATNLIDVDRISRDQMHWHWSQFDPTQVVRDTVTMLQALAQSNQRTLVLGTLQTPSIYGDDSACRRLLTNLIANAIKHSRATTITVSCQGDAAETRILVADDGAGIDPAARGRLGKPFAATGEASPLGGVGLGLSICLGIAAVHGGHIAIRSRLGQGTTVTVTLRGDRGGPAAITGAIGFVELDLG